MNGYEWKQNGAGIFVYHHGQTRHGYDFLVYDDDQLVVVKVKSLKLNGVEGKIERGLDPARMIHPEPRTLICFPTYTNKNRDVACIEGKYPQVTCIDTGYKKQQLRRAVNRFYEERVS